MRPQRGLVRSRRLRGGLRPAPLHRAALLLAVLTLSALGATPATAGVDAGAHAAASPATATTAAAVGAAAAAKSSKPHRRHHTKRGTAACRRQRHTKRLRCPHGDVKSKARSHARAKHKPARHSTTAPPSPTTGSGTTAAGSPLDPTLPGAPGTPSTTPPSTPPTTPSDPSSPAHVQVTAQDSQSFSFTLSRPTVAAGPVVVQFVNRGQDPHNLHIAPASPAGASDVGALPQDAQPGTTQTVHFTLAPGTYTLYCAIPGHELAGMKATLVVN